MKLEKRTEETGAPAVVVILVVWNGVEDTLECLRSLREERYPNKQILIVDNASSDGSSERILAEGFEVCILRLEKNLGFTGGNNVGLFHAQSLGVKYAFLLNNDTTLEPDALARLVEAAERNGDAGMLAPVMHYYDRPDEVWFAGASLSLTRAEALHAAPSSLSGDIGVDSQDSNIIPQRKQDMDVYPSPWVSGCAMLVRMTAFGQVGGFDERFYLTWEDVDWCVRMHQQGWRVLVVPAARIYHKGGRSGSRLTGVHRYYAVRNSLLLASKHAGVGYVPALFWVSVRHLRGAMGSEPGERVASLLTVMEGLWDHFKGCYGIRRKGGQAPDVETRRETKQEINHPEVAGV